MPTINPDPHSQDPARQLLRHALATLAYRGGKVIRGTPADFASFTCGGGCRSAGQILAHIGDLLDWALSIAKGQQEWHNSQPQSWQDDINRFHAALASFDSYLVSNQPLHVSAEKLFQGPIADALTHVGQLAMMRRIAGSPIKSENYFVADIATGHVGTDQPAPKREF